MATLAECLLVIRDWSEVKGKKSVILKEGGGKRNKGGVCLFVIIGAPCTLKWTQNVE